ncbi:hypothetical protein SAMN03159316_3809 [Pseudomonas sp. NFR02]|uniref:membrane-targeted effector domain-containing toxin n=1 Tax=Pseudomonas sp. NFR02 TaxID=1566229 RepID=UPI00091EC1DF|nr:membrane-targeted effector domain-containing toxin [Pseudomonas sp. NFR02]SFY14051.1 hypothetical protein SAMN03159316_3809 [Pseudomonas sp. NFR02]
MSTGTPLPNAADKAALITLATQIIPACPSLNDSAHQTACDILQKHGVKGLDPDDVYYHRFKSAQSSTKTFTGWEHLLEKPYESTTLTQLVIHRFRATDFDNADLLDLYGGFYTAGPVYGDFNETNEVRLHGNEVLKDFWNIRFDSLYNGQLDDFWHSHADDFRTLAKCNFLSKAVQAADLKQLTKEDLETCISTVASNVTWPITRKMLQTEVSAGAPPQVYALDVDGHVAFNLLRIVDPKGRQILYTPGDTPAFQVLETPADMHWWVLGKMNNEQSRDAFLCHFPLSDRLAMQENITDLMNRLVGTWGKSDHHLINRKNQAINVDAFSWLMERTRWSMYDEARQLLTTQKDLQKKLWIGYLSAGLKVFGPMAAIGWEVALPVLGASIALTGMNIDQAVNGRTRAERKAGVTAAVINGIAMLFNVLALAGPGPITEVGAEVDAAEAAEMAEYKKELQPEPVDEPAVTPTGGETTVPPTAGEPPAATSQIPTSWKRLQGLEEATPMTEGGRYRNIYTVKANPSTVIKFKDAVYYVRYEADINGEGSWAIIDPQNPNAFYGTRPVQLNAAGEWELALRPSDAIRGGAPVDTVAAGETRLGTSTVEETMPSSYGSPNASNPPSSLGTAYDLNDLDPYQIELAMGGRPDHFKRIPKPGGGFTDFYTSDYFINPARTKILTAARQFFSRPFFIHSLPERPALPSLTPEMSSTELIEAVFKTAPGLVVAESPNRIASLYVLIKDMPALARQGIKTLYLNRLFNDLHQLDLDTFANTGVLSDDLKVYLEQMDALLPVRFNTQALLTAARAYGIRVQATGCLANYRSFAVAMDEQMAKNFLTSEIIRLDQLKNGVGKWVALTGAQNTNTFRGVAGISEINGGTSLRIVEELNAASPKVEVRLGPKVVNRPKVNPSLNALDTDLSLKIPMTELEMPRTYVFTERQVEDALKLPGDYLLEQTQSTLTLIHRNRLKALVRSTIQSTISQGYFIDAAQFPRLNGNVYNSLPELLQALNNQGMRFRGLPLIKTPVPTAEVNINNVPAYDDIPPPAGFVPAVNLPVMPAATSTPQVPPAWEANEILEGEAPVSEPGKYQGIYRLTSDPGEAILYDGKPYYVRYETYRGGTSGWAIINPHAPNATADSIAVRLNAQGQWETFAR